MFSLKKISQNNNHSISLFINYILPIFLILIGIFQTYREAFLLWYGEADEITHPLLINAINQYGWSFIKNYQFPIDNWFFTLIFPYKLIYSLFGNNLTVITATGPIIFWLTALLTGLIINYITKNKVKALWACAFILMAPQTALWHGGYLVHSVAHHVSVLWGMVALLCYFLWIDYKNYIALISAIILLSFSTFSDAWILPTFDLPILCASLGMIYLDKKDAVNKAYKTWASIIASVILIILIYKTHFLGLFILSNVTVSPFSHLKFSFNSVIHALEGLPYYFNFIPFCDLTKFPIYWATKNIPHIILTFFAVIFNITALLTSISFLIYKIFQNIKHQNKVANFLFFFLIFSILGIFSSLFITVRLHISPFGSMNATETRYIVNLFYAFIILTFILPFSKISQHSQKCLIFLGGMFLCTGLISNDQVWDLERTHPDFQQEKDVISTLEKNNIHYAFGQIIDDIGRNPNSEVINMLTSHHTVFHPIVGGGNAFSLGFWLSTSYYKIPLHQKWAFLLPDQQPLDCSPFPSCQEAIIHQFGQPLETKHQNYMTYFIYNNDQTDILHHLKFPPLTEKDLSRWQSYYPNDQLNLNQLITIDGWDWEHIHNHKIQSNKEWAFFIMPISNPHPHLHLRIKLNSSTLTSRNINILYKNNIIAQWRISNDEAVQEFNIPINPHEKNAEFKIHILNPDSSKEYGLVGITLSEVQIVEDENN